MERSDWYVKTVDLIRARFFYAQGFLIAGSRHYFSEDYDFDEAAVERT
jgi:hypothetical protein